MTLRSRRGTASQRAALAIDMAARAEPKPDALRDGLLATVDALRRRRADQVDATLIDGYVARNWLEWSGGSLKLTLTGSNIVSQLRAGLR